MKHGDLSDPVAGPGEVVIDVVAAGVNGADWKVRVGQYKQSKFPFALGRDFSGVVNAIGEGVADFKVGDAVFGICEAGQEGAYAEKTAVKAAIVAKKPNELSHVNAARLGAHRSHSNECCRGYVETAARGEDPDPRRMGWVASSAIQPAKHIGAYVITTASAANHAYLRDVGADEIIDHNASDFTQVVASCCEMVQHDRNSL